MKEMNLRPYQKKAIEKIVQSLEHGKLILSIDNNDLIEMLKLKSDKAADYILDKLESFLMEISK